MNSEMKDYQEKLKKNIYVLIENNRLKEAKELVNQYENIISNDIEVYSIKGVIAIMEGNAEEAECILTKGLEIQPFNFDILYNLAYLYESNEKYITAYRYYIKALKVIDGEIEESIRSKLDELEKIGKVKEYISRKKVLFIAHIFPPSGGSGVQRSLKFVKYLRAFGWEPIVVTVGNTMYSLKDETLVSEIPEEIEIIRIDEKVNIDIAYVNKLVQIYSSVVNDNDLMEEYINELNKSQEHLSRLLIQPDTYILWATEVLDKIDDKVDFEQIDMIYTTSGPCSDHIIGYYLKQKYNIPWVADFRDEWTNNPYVNFDKNSILYKVNYAMENNIVSHADSIIAVTPTSKLNYEKIFCLEANKAHEITNGYDEEDFNNLISKKEKNDKFTIVHNGLLYMIRTPETFLKAITNLIKNGKINKSKINVLFPLIENEEKWKEYIMDNDLVDVVKITGYLNHKESLDLATNSDLLLLIIGSGVENRSVYTGKVFEYLRLCKPILSMSPKESLVEKLIDKTNRGKNFEFDDIQGIEDYILEMYIKWEKGDINELKITKDIKSYDRIALTNKLTNIFDSLIISKRINKKKIVFFSIKNGDSFLRDIIRKLSNVYEVRKIIVTNFNQIDEGMAWADICWFEWCDQLVVYGSKHKLAKEKKLICRLHSYEAFTDYTLNVEWDNIDKVIFVAQHIKEHVLSKINIDESKIEIIHNGIDVNRFSFVEREPGFNIAYVGYINYKKGPMLLLHTFKAIFEKDERYKLHIAGTFQDERYSLYFNQKIKEFGLENNVIFYGWQDNISKWLENKNYIICTSVFEGNPVALMEAMSRGIKPIIHSFVGAKQLYPEEYVWDTIDEAVEIVLRDDYNSNRYRSYIENNFSLEIQLKRIKKVIDNMITNKNVNNPHIKGINVTDFYDYLSGSKFSSGLKVHVENSNIKIIDRISYLMEVCKNKKVIHLGCADHLELINSKRQNNLWLHELLTNVSQKCIGFDINEEAINYLNKDLKISNVFYKDIISKRCDMIYNDKWDIMVIGEILEHVNNPVEFLSNIKALYKGSLQNLVITVPNALRLENYMFSQNGYECINSDHRYWFTPYTISKIVYESGLEVEEIFMTSSYKVIDENVRNILVNNNIFMDTIGVVIRL